jgi:hypothetical protein
MAQKPKLAKHKQNPSELRRNKNNSIWFEITHQYSRGKRKAGLWEIPGNFNLKHPHPIHHPDTATIDDDIDDIDEEVEKKTPVKKPKPAKKKPVKKPEKKPLTLSDILGDDYLEI